MYCLRIEPCFVKETIERRKTITFHGFEVADSLTDPETNEIYDYRKIFVLSSQLKEVEERVRE